MGRGGGRREGGRDHLFFLCAPGEGQARPRPQSKRPGLICPSRLLLSQSSAPGPRFLLLFAVTGAVAAGAGAAGCAGGAGWGARVPGPLSCVLDCRPPLLRAWSVCPASTIFSAIVRLLSLSLSLVMDIEACLHVFLSLRNVHNRLFTVPARPSWSRRSVSAIIVLVRILYPQKRRPATGNQGL